MCDSGVEWEGLRWRSNSRVISIQDVCKALGQMGASWESELGSGKVPGPTCRERQHVDTGKMREKGTEQGSCEVGGGPRECGPGRYRKDCTWRRAQSPG